MQKSTDFRRRAADLLCRELSGFSFSSHVVFSCDVFPPVNWLTSGELLKYKWNKEKSTKEISFYFVRFFSLKTVWLNWSSWMDLKLTIVSIENRRTIYRRFSLFNLRKFRCSVSLSFMYALYEKTGILCYC